MTFRAMRDSAAVRLSKALIIGLLAVGLTACSAVRWSYDNGPLLAQWWLDGWLDLDGPQTAEARSALEQWFAWHRATELPDHAELLGRWLVQIEGPVTPAQACEAFEDVRTRIDRGVAQLLPAAARLLPSISAEQWAHLARRQSERLAEARRDYAQPRREDRVAASLERTFERAEEYYGPLEPRQRELLAAAVAGSPFDAELWLRERVDRHDALVQTLRAAQPRDEAARLQALREVARRHLHPPPGPYAEMQQRWQTHGCETAARLHDTVTPAQRAHLRQRLEAWQEDLRALAAHGGG